MYITASHLWWHRHPDSAWRHLVCASPIAWSIYEFLNVQNNLAFPRDSTDVPSTATRNGNGSIEGSSRQVGSVGEQMKRLATSPYRIETIVSTAGHSFVSPPVSLTDERLWTRHLNRVAASHVGYYLSANTNCFNHELNCRKGFDFTGLLGLGKK
jgi:hypothetical protein